MPNTLGTAKNHSGLKLSSHAKQRLNSELSHGRKETLLLTEQHEHPQLLPLLSYHQNRRLAQFPLNLVRSTLIQPDSPLGVGLDAARLLTARAAQHRSPHTPRCRVGPRQFCPPMSLVRHPTAFNKPGCTCCIHVPAQSWADVFQRTSAPSPRWGAPVHFRSQPLSILFSLLLRRALQCLVCSKPSLQEVGALQCTLLKHSANMQLNSASKYYCREKRTI